MINGRYIEPYENYNVKSKQGPWNLEFLVVTKIVKTCTNRNIDNHWSVE